MGEQTINQQVAEARGLMNLHSRSAQLAILITTFLSFTLLLVLWLNYPSYTVLLQHVDSAMLAKVSSELQKNNIAYQYESSSETVLVPERSLYKAKFILGSRELEQGTVSRLLINQDFDETSTTDVASSRSGNSLYPGRFFALESELAKTIASINNIEWARVHLAVDNSDSATSKAESRASVFVRLAKGKALGEQQITAITHLIASSAPNLTEKNIAVIDQSGNLLKSANHDFPGAESTLRYSYARMLEQSYINKIESLLVPIFGERALHVQVDAEIEFAHDEKIQSGHIASKGHVLKKLMATVVVDHKIVNSEYGQPVRVTRTRNELQRIEQLVREAIGFDEKRGDRVNIFNEPFGNGVDQLDKKEGFLTEGSQYYYFKVLAVTLCGLLITILILRYVIQKIIEMRPVMILPDTTGGEAVAHATNWVAIQAADLPQDDKLPGNTTSIYETLLAKTRSQVNENPAQVARIIKSWVRDNGR